MKLFRPDTICGTLLMLMAAGPATLPTTQPADGHEFVDPQHRFHLRYPADWILPPTPVQYQVFGVHAPAAADGTFAELGLRIDPAPPDLPDASTLADLAGTTVGIVSHNGGAHVRITRGYLGTFPARTVQFDRKNTRVMYIMTVHDHVQYVFNFAAPANRFDAERQRANEVFKSFELIDP